jgi:hypothetical protein
VYVRIARKHVTGIKKLFEQILPNSSSREPVCARASKYWGKGKRGEIKGGIKGGLTEGGERDGD